MKVLVDCTNAYDHPGNKSGIPRVVRSIVSNLNKVQDVTLAVPVILRFGHIYGVRQLPSAQSGPYTLSALRSILIRVHNRLRWFCSCIENCRTFRSHAYLRKAFLWIGRLFNLVIELPISMITSLCVLLDKRSQVVELEVNPGDVLLLLDATWGSDVYQSIEKLKSQGIIVVAVVYDLIPLTHPHFFNKRLVELFNGWLKWSAQIVDGYIAISRTVCDQLQTLISQQTSSVQWYDFFYLGTELDLVRKDGVVRQHVKAPFQEGRPVYLAVSTIEPRKNHLYLLKAFEMLWNEGVKVSLLIVGKVGWKCQSIIQQIKGNSYFNRYLFMLHDIDDTELEYCYSQSRCLISPSYLEGFGLPLVEAMQRGLPVMGSDIPVFREVGGDFISYFDPHQPGTLAALVQNFEMHGELPAAKSLSEWSWMSWEFSTRQLLTKVKSHLNAHSCDIGNQDSLSVH